MTEIPLVFHKAVVPYLKDVKTGPKLFAPSITVNSIEDYLRECNHSKSEVKKSLKIIYRGQTSDYVMPDGTISLLTGRERESTDGAWRYSPFYDNSHLTKHFKKYVDNVQVIHRKESKPFPLTPDTPNIYYESVLLQALLQHYGLPTTCVDATTDPLVALWFAFNKREHIPAMKNVVNAVTYKNSNEDYGIVYILSVPKPNIGRNRRIIPNIISADLSAEIPNNNWRPSRQSAFAIFQYQWGVTPGLNWNRIANCIVKHIIVSKRVFEQLDDQLKSRLNMRRLFPSCLEDSIYSDFIKKKVFRKIQYNPDLLIYPEYLWHFNWCKIHKDEMECFFNQPI